MKETIIAVGNGGYNLATDIIAAGLFPDARLMVCDTNEKDLEKNSVNAAESFLLEKLRKSVKSGDTNLVDEIVEKASDSVIVCATLGGMTGSKYAPLIALDAILKGKFVSSFFSLRRRAGRGAQLQEPQRCPQRQRRPQVGNHYDAQHRYRLRIPQRTNQRYDRILQQVQDRKSVV